MGISINIVWGFDFVEAMKCLYELLHPNKTCYYMILFLLDSYSLWNMECGVDANGMFMSHPLGTINIHIKFKASLDSVCCDKMHRQADRWSRLQLY